MTTVTVSRDYRVLIPLDARDALGIQPGLKVEVIAYEGRLELVPVYTPKRLRGFLRGIDTLVPREFDRKDAAT